ncbi:Formylglycine-generating sulfatase enzyme [Posidoniimonas polymericola]|uniref:Formylglycine-generating sulfatase enzyme n=1 Tax=Posidoniimonas polymericola TaxID=2528002 RepID=A0A5C5YLN9_9BACT|nr:SUMF1/EgtB/PvdO family nonheme iron enzyme [Posidoniimonas polymericola]TWT75871.1 Formylglycine-generating sulfatase enzyme [Posidoniimonas polymericola]
MPRFTMMPRFMISAVFAIIAGCLTSACLAEDAPTPGLTQKQPAAGPYVKTDRGYMVPYEVKVPGSGATFKMTPIAGGVVSVGPRTASADEDDDPQSPSRQVRLEPYWIGTHEVTWADYRPYMELNTTFGEIAFLRGQLYDGSPKLEQALADRPALQQAVDAMPQGVDCITAPTALYDPSTTYYSGEEPELPAVTMTVYAAQQYTKWLSVLTGGAYRLPCEAEWEHAARADASGDAPRQPLDPIAWYDDNSDYEAQPVGLKEPNANGLYDTLGNAAEWVLDVPSTEAPAAGDPMPWSESVGQPQQVDPRIAKGGYYESEAAELTFTSRLLSADEDWKASDPNVPLSPWWFADDPAMGVGFRVVRQLEPMTDEQKQIAWEASSPDLQNGVKQRVQGGRGKMQVITPDLPKVVEQLNEPEIRKLME